MFVSSISNWSRHASYFTLPIQVNPWLCRNIKQSKVRLTNFSWGNYRLTDSNRKIALYPILISTSTHKTNLWVAFSRSSPNAECDSTNWFVQNIYLWYIRTVVPRWSALCFLHLICSWLPHYIDGLMQKRRNSIANAMELRLSYINPSIFKQQSAYHVHILGTYCASLFILFWNNTR